jgi:hypothetical protein
MVLYRKNSCLKTETGVNRDFYTFFIGENERNFSVLGDLGVSYFEVGNDSEHLGKSALPLEVVPPFSGKQHPKTILIAFH